MGMTLQRLEDRESFCAFAIKQGRSTWAKLWYILPECEPSGAQATKHELQKIYLFTYTLS